jgi:hypothetical protein
MGTITIVHGKNSVKGIYKDGSLVATQDKGCSPQDLEDCVKQHGGDSPYDVIDTDSTCGNVLEMPTKLVPVATVAVLKKKPNKKI